MQYKLKKEVNPKYSVIEQILTNRNIPYEETYHYLHTTDNDINNPESFGEENVKAGVKMLLKAIKNNDSTLVICDCDCDGFTSAALLINYLYDLFPAFVINHIKWYVHSDKQHGLADVMDYINQKDFKLILVPDAGSNDIPQHKELYEKGISTLILDHHLTDEVSQYAITINNQTCNYKNKDLSGVGVVWQFCRYLDSWFETDYANNYLDLVALGLTGDMMSLSSFETKHLINKGFEPDAIKNPYIYGMWQKNKFKLGEHITSMDAAFYIVPMVNAVQRSGTIEEKELLFKAMLNHHAFEMIPSNKRGHLPGEMEKLVDQAVRMSTNVKNRQTRVQDESISFLEQMIEENNMLNHKVLLFTLEGGKVDKNIAGLIANKFAAKYQRPCCILTKCENEIKPFEELDNKENNVTYQGSARGYEISGVTNFKDICEETQCVDWTAGHQNAFGICIPEEKINQFLIETDKLLANMSSEPIYYVDYIYRGADVLPEDILSISELSNLWGKDFEEALIAVQGLAIEAKDIAIYKKTSNTLKITLPNKVSLMKFNISDEECELFENIKGYLKLDVVGRCSKNEWMGNISAQIFIENYEVVGQGGYLF